MPGAGPATRPPCERAAAPPGTLIEKNRSIRTDLRISASAACLHGNILVSLFLEPFVKYPSVSFLNFYLNHFLTWNPFLLEAIRFQLTRSHKSLSGLHPNFFQGFHLEHNKLDVHSCYFGDCSNSDDAVSTLKTPHDSPIRANVLDGISARGGELFWNTRFLECGVMTCSSAQSGFCLVSSQQWNLSISNTSDSLFLFLTVDPG